MRRVSLLLLVLAACGLVGWRAALVEASAREFISGSVLVDPLPTFVEPAVLALFGFGLIYGAARLRKRRSTRLGQ